MERTNDNSGPAGRPRIPDFLRDDKPTGISQRRWERLLRDSGLSPAKQRLIREYTSGRRQWPHWTKLLLSRRDITDEEIRRLLLSIANPREASLEEYLAARGEPHQLEMSWTRQQVLSFSMYLGLLIILLVALLWPGPGGTPVSQPAGSQAARLTSTALTGTTLSFRELLSWEWEDPQMIRADGWVPVVSVINVDGDADQEVLAQHREFTWQQTGISGMTTGTRLVLTVLDTAGVLRDVPSPGYTAATRVFAWDWDGSGVSELVVPDEPNSRIEVYNQAGIWYAEIPGLSADSVQMLIPQRQADFNGDGIPELLLMDPDRWGMAAYDRSGTETWRPASFFQFMFAVPCDLDGDGAQRALIDVSATPFRAYGPQLPEAGLELPATIPQGNASNSPWSACADLNGDGCQELIVPEQGYLDLRTGSFTPFDWSFAANPFTRTAGNPAGARYDWGHRLAVGDFVGDGELEIAVTAMPDSQPAEVSESILCLFDTQGQVVHCERLNGLVWEATTIRSGGRDYLVLALSDRVLMYP